MKPLVVAHNKAATPNLTPGRTAYGEAVFVQDGREYRVWSPYRSKLAAYACKGGKAAEFANDAIVLYLGAAQGTTASHVSDLVPDGLVVAVEKSPLAVLSLLEVLAHRPNTVPILSDARRLESEGRLLPPRVDVLYQDVAQADQTEIFLRAAARFRPRLGFLCLKARSVAVEARPRDVFREARDAIAAAGHGLIDWMTLDPFQRDHAVFAVRFKEWGPPGA